MTHFNLLLCWGIGLSLCVVGMGCATRQRPMEAAPRASAGPKPQPDERAVVETDVGPVMTVLGHSVEGRAIRAYRFAGHGGTVLIFGGFHGDEPKSVYVAERFVELLRSEPALRGERSVVIVPNVNPDGYERRTRRNARKVDINRNFPTANWAHADPRKRMYGGPAPMSEPETRIVHDLVRELRPDVIVSIHTIGRGRHCNNYDGPGEALAELMAAKNGYPAEGSIGYPTPGSFGSWAGKELSIPTITLEMPSRASKTKCWPVNRDALLAVLGR